MLTGLTWVVAHLTAFVAPSHGQFSTDKSLRRFLQDYANVPSLPQDKATRYFDVFVDLNSDSQEEIVVYLVGPQWCGSGGCTVLILLPEGSTFRVLTRITIVRRPVRVLAATCNGWQSLGVWVQGGGVSAGYEAILKFDGRTYPSNPTVSPAQRSRRKEKGKIIISDELKNLKPLYPEE